MSRASESQISKGGDQASVTDGSPIRVVIADGQKLFADALRMALPLVANIEVVGPIATSGLEALETVQEHKPDVAVLDYWLEGMAGPAATAAILANDADRKVLMIAWLFGPREIEAALRAGVTGFIPKSLAVGALAAAISRASRGEFPVSTGHIDEMVRSFGLFRELEPQVDQDQTVEEKRRLATLTPREVRILLQLSRTGRPERAAAALGIAPATVRTHLHNIYQKTGARTQMEAVAMALRHRIISD